MENVFFRAICRTGIFMICAQALVHFRPQESYEKYLKLLVSVMVLIQLFLPVGNALAGVESLAGADGLSGFLEGMEQSMEEAMLEAEQADELLARMTLEEVRRRMEEQEGGEQPAQPDAMGGEVSPGLSTEFPREESIGEEWRNIAVELNPVEPVVLE